MEPSEEGKKVISQEEWDRMRNAVSVAKEDMNLLVMNFLVTEGFMDAAAAFQEESGTSAENCSEVAEDRMHIRTAVEQGRIEEAVERVNDLNPEILEENSTLFFHLQQQQLIELIRVGKIEEALAFAQEFLAYKGEENTAFLDDLESTIALVAFSDPHESPVKHLMDASQRQQTASELNSAILEKYEQEREPRLAMLMKLLMWGQERLAKKVTFPRLAELIGSDAGP